jgi:trans-2,3-dihydro-3-hydroxyanthranilate isomerase
MSRIVWVDVFASAPMTGNPLAVVLEADGLEPARMQELAAELGISETVFVLPPASPDHAARLRIFTPRLELPMAGHPVVGAAWVISTAGDMGGEGSLETGVGPLEVRVSGQVATMMQAPPVAGPTVNAVEVATACGLPPEAALDARVWSTGIPQLMVRVPTVQELADARPDGLEIARLGERDGWVGVSLYAITDAEAKTGRVEAQVRHFAPGAGVLEDPGTGSAAGGLGACLAAAGFGTASALQLVVRQGIELGRHSEIAVRVSIEDGAPRRVQVGGRVVPLFQGRLIRL